MMFLRTAPTLTRRVRRRGPEEIQNRLREQSHRRELTLEDRTRIAALVNEYAWLIDHERWHDVRDLCAEDVSLRLGRWEINGYPELTDWANECSAAESRQTQHQMTNLASRRTVRIERRAWPSSSSTSRSTGAVERTLT